VSTVVVLDYGSGNVRSALRAIERTGATVTLTADLDTAYTADGLVVPGVGAFAAVMARLVTCGGAELVARRIAAGRPVLGICVGLQVLFELGTEHGVTTKGLGLLPGEVTALEAPRVPHMGWNTVDPPPGSALFAGAAPSAWYYFVHSYAARPVAATGVAWTLANHGHDFVAAVEAGPLSGTQFHPEKSGPAGAGLLTNWVRAL
jgi:glutamine amidotransferase